MAGKRREKGDGSVYQRKSDGLWLARYTPEGSAKTKYLSGKTEQEVKRKLREFKKEAAKNDYVEVQKISVRQYMDRWFNEIKLNELKSKSADRTEQILQHQIFPCIGDIQLAALTANDIQGMIGTLVTKGYAFETIKKSYNNVNSCLKLAILKGDIVKNPCIGVILPKKLEKNKRDIRFFTQEEAAKICEASVLKYGNGIPVYRLGHAVIVLIYTGMRISELLGLKWKNIDYAKKTAKVEDSAITIKDRDRDENDSEKPKYKLVIQESVKTESSERYVVLNIKAIAALKAIQEFNGQHEYVMATETGSVFGHRNFDRMLRSIVSRCDLEPCGAHVLRHTFASMLFRKGVDVKKVSELLGHKDVSTTYNTYIHLIKEQKQEAVDILDEL